LKPLEENGFIIVNFTPESITIRFVRFNCHKQAPDVIDTLINHTVNRNTCRQTCTALVSAQVCGGAHNSIIAQHERDALGHAGISILRSLVLDRCCGA
jgi:hypothetical protein